MLTLIQDLRLAARSLRRHPVFAIASVSVLALGVGANVAVFPIVDAILLQPLPYAQSDRLVAVFEEPDRPDSAPARNPTSPTNFLEWSEQSRTLGDFTAAHPWNPVLGTEGAPVQLQGLKATPSLFRLLGAEAALGRCFGPDDAPSEGLVAVLGYDLWQSHFGGDPSIVGRSIELDGEGYQVQGVMPQGFAFPPFWAVGAQLWTPLRFSPTESARRNARFLRVFARLEPESTLEQAQEELQSLAALQSRLSPRTHEGITASVEPLLEPVVADSRRTLLFLWSAVAMVLLIACANWTGLLAERALQRRREAAVRLALGASRWRLARLQLCESILLAAAGGAAGWILGGWGHRVALSLIPVDLPRLQEAAPDWRVALLAALGAGSCALLFAAAPLLRWQPRRATESLQSTRASNAASQGSGRLRWILAAGQSALAVMLLIGAILLGRTLENLAALKPGFEKSGVATFLVSMAASANLDSARQQILFRRILQEVESLPGVERAGLVNHLPIDGDIWSNQYSGDSGASTPPQTVRAYVRVASPGYFESLGIRLEAGRAFTQADQEAGRPIAVVNQRLAGLLWPGQDPVGKRFKGGAADSSAPWMEVVGVVSDIRQRSLRTATTAEIYRPYAQNPFPWYRTFTLTVRSKSESADSLFRPTMEALHRIDDDLAISRVQEISQVVSGQLRGPRFNSLLVGVFAAAAALLSAVGLYARIAFSLRRRAHETGVRMALGAQPKDILRLSLVQGVGPAAAGIAVGVLLAGALSRSLSSLLFEVGSLDPAAFSAAASAMLLTSIAACLPAARRAAWSDPLTTLRSQ